MPLLLGFPNSNGEEKKEVDNRRNPRTLECMKICPKCGQAKDPTDFYKNRSLSDGLQTYCKACLKISFAGAGPDGLTSSQRWYQRNPEKWRGYGLKSKYDLSVQQFDAMLSSQGGACAICQGVNKKWCVDHDHATGKVRSILCSCCNFAIGHLGDSARIATAAAAYLTKHGNP